MSRPRPQRSTSLVKPTKRIFQRWKRDFENEILRWQTKRYYSTDENPVTLTQTLHHASSDLCPNVVTIITILLTMPVSLQSEDVLTFHDENRATRSTCPGACSHTHTR